MRLNYKILWFEDDDGFYDSLNRDEISTHLGAKGFETTFTRMKGEEPFEELISKAQKSDLIVMDFALEGVQQGDDLIEQIRDGSIYTEVVFYSAAGVGKLWERVCEKELNGVHCCGRNEITSDVIPIIDSTIRKILDLENSRGLVMAELGELDILMNDIIVTVHSADEKKKDFIRQKIKKKLEEHGRSISRRLERFDKLTIEELVLEALDSSKRLNTMISICNELKIEAYSERLKGYNDTVLFPRNCLGHGTAEDIPEGGYVFRHGKKEFIFNDESSAELRNNFRDFKSCLHELRAKILAICKG